MTVAMTVAMTVVIVAMDAMDATAATAAPAAAAAENAQEAAKSDAFFPKPSRASSPYHTSSVQSSPFIMELHLGHTILITIFELGRCRGHVYHMLIKNATNRLVD